MNFVVVIQSLNFGAQSGLWLKNVTFKKSRKKGERKKLLTEQVLVDMNFETHNPDFKFEMLPIKKSTKKGKDALDRVDCGIHEL